jgi:acetyltransferase-like isoleucine patch superfamily enzyme
MEFIKTFFARLIQLFQIATYYVLNAYQYKKLEFKALVIKPLRISGKKYISICKSVRVNKYAWLIALKLDDYEPELIIQKGCSLGDFNHIAAVRKVVLGEFVLTANGVYISDNIHSYEDINLPVMHQPVRFKSEVYIGDGSWIGENACIIGAKIGKHCIVGANAVVTSDIPDYSVAVGMPARVIKKYNLATKKWERTEA